jgi:hypothetical protein
MFLNPNWRWAESQRQFFIETAKHTIFREGKTGESAIFAFTLFFRYAIEHTKYLLINKG